MNIPSSSPAAVDEAAGVAVVAAMVVAAVAVLQRDEPPYCWQQ